MRGVSSGHTDWDKKGEEKVHETFGKYLLVHLRWFYQRNGLGIVRRFVVHHYCRHSIWAAVLQVCNDIVLAFWKKDRIWRRCRFISRECDLVPSKRMVDGTWQLPDRLCLVHHDCRNSVWETVLQDRQAGAAAVWCICRPDLNECVELHEGTDLPC